MSCCGKTICSGCSYAPVYDNQGNKVDNQKCAFCRTPDPDTEKEINERQMKRVEMNDPILQFSTLELTIVMGILVCHKIIERH